MWVWGWGHKPSTAEGLLPSVLTDCSMISSSHVPKAPRDSHTLWVQTDWFQTDWPAPTPLPPVSLLLERCLQPRISKGGRRRRKWFCFLWWTRKGSLSTQKNKATQKCLIIARDYLWGMAERREMGETKDFKPAVWFCSPRTKERHLKFSSLWSERFWRQGLGTGGGGGGCFHWRRK